MKKTGLLYIFSFILISSSALMSASLFDPSLRWKTIKTANFYIHYHQNLEKCATRLSVISEEIHEKMVKKIGWKPFFRTDIVLVDNQDMANGYASPFPFNRIQIFISRPEPDSVISNFDNWLRFVFTHEYAHILNMDQVRGIPEGTRYIFGRLYFPNVFLPIFIQEGNAVYHESESGFGRNNSSYTDMVFRKEIESGKLKGIDEASFYPRQWPAGNIPYLYGGSFVSYCEAVYGKGSFAGIFEENSDNIVPFLNDKNFRDVYKTKAGAIWKDWSNYVRVIYSRQIEKIKSAGITEQKIISEKEKNSLFPRFSPDGYYLFYSSSSTRTPTYLIRHNIRDGSEKKLCVLNHPNGISVSENGKIIISDLEYLNSFSLFSEAFVFDGRKTQLTENLRGKYVDISKGGDLVYITNRNDRFSLFKSNEKFDRKTEIISNSEIQISTPRLSIDSGQIAMSIKESDGRSNIVIYDIEKKSFKRITNGRYNDIHPAWRNDGTGIIFSSDRSGAYNLYEYIFKTGELSRITNLVGGAFSPDISPDGKTVAFSSYESYGYAVSLIPYPEKKYDTVISVPAELQPGFFNTAKSDTAEIEGEGYSPLNSVLPAYVIPVIPFIYSREYYPGKSETYAALSTSGNDALYRHSYYLAAEYKFITKNALIDLSYTYSGLYPDITAGYTDSTLFAGKDSFPYNDQNNINFRRRLTKAGYLNFLFPFIRYQSIKALSLSYVYEKNTYDTFYYGSGTFRDTDRLAKIQALLYFNNSSFYPYSVSPENGREIYILSDFYRKELLSDSSYYIYRGSYTEYLPGIFSNNVLMLHLGGGFSLHNPGTSSLFSIERENGPFYDKMNALGSWGIRGFPHGTFYGLRAANASIEYRFPVFQRDAGFETFPMLFRDLWLLFFGDAANVWDRKISLRENFYSAGLEVHVNFTAAYAAELTFYTGYAHGFGKSGENQFYFGIGMIPEKTGKNNIKRVDYF